MTGASDTRARYERLIERARRSDVVEIIAAFVFFVAGGVLLLAEHEVPGVPAGIALVALGMTTVVVRLAEDLARLRSAQDPRILLERRAELLERSGRWYVAPLVPGIVWTVAAATLQSPVRAPSLMAGAAVLLVVIALGTWIVLANHAAARKLRVELGRRAPPACHDRPS
jgi:hypothetical protein